MTSSDVLEKARLMFFREQQGGREVGWVENETQKKFRPLSGPVFRTTEEA